MKFQRSLKSEATVDITPLIDVVFILLLFFMVTTSFTRESSLLINLPEASGEATTDDPLHIDILINRDGSYAVNGRPLPDTSLATLMEAVTGLADGDVAAPVTITADADTTHQSVVTAMDAVAQLGFTRLNIATRQAGAE